jgi:hypothetical protein
MPEMIENETKNATTHPAWLGPSAAQLCWAGVAKSKPLGSEKRLFAGQKWPNPLGSSAEPLDLTIQREQVSSCQKLPIAKTEHLC